MKYRLQEIGDFSNDMHQRYQMFSLRYRIEDTVLEIRTVFVAAPTMESATLAARQNIPVTAKIENITLMGDALVGV